MLPNEDPTPAELLEAILEVSLTGMMLLRPVYEADGATIRDFRYERLNPAAQQLLRLPAHPPESLVTTYPGVVEAGILAFYAEAFRAGQVRRYQVHYPHDGLDSYFQLVARRQGERLVVGFSDTNHQPRTAVEHALRQSQAQDQKARQEAERVRADLTRAFEQAPVAFALFRGAELVVEFANPEVGLMLGRPVASILGRPVFEAIPDMRGQGLEELMSRTFTDGTPYDLLEVPVHFEREHEGRPKQGYFNITYRPQHDAQGQRVGVVCVGVEVTAQVVAHQQLEEKERQTHHLNQELHANNAELERIQQQLRQLNAGLEDRVQQRTAQLQEQQGLLHQILGQVPALIATLNGPEHRFSFFNAPYNEVLDGRAVLGQPMAECLPELAEQGFLALLDQVYTTGKPYVGTELPFLFAQDAGPLVPRYFTFTYQPLTAATGEVQGILVFAVEVTAQVQARRQADTLQAAMLAVAQRQAQQRRELYQVFEQTLVAIVLLREPDHRIDYFNPAFEELFPPEEWAGGSLQGHTLAEVYPRIREAGLVALLDRVYATGESQSVLDMPLAVLQPGSPRFVSFAYQAYREQERIVGVAAFVYDTTEQVLARRVREAQQQELQQVFEQAPVAIGILSGPTLRVELANAALSRLWGRPAAQVLGRPLFEAVPDLAGQGFEQLLADILASGQPHHLTAVPVQLDPAQSGRPHTGYFNCSYQPWTDASTGVPGLVAVAVEVTEQVKARQQTQQLNEELHLSNTRLLRTNADLDTFVYSASHDLKSPITNIEGLLLALRQHLPPPALAGELVPTLLEMMDGAVQRFQQTLGHLTDVSRLQQELTDVPESIDLAALVEAVRLDMLPELTAAGATLTVALQSCPAVYFPAKNLRSILYNLLSNAVKYRAPDRPARVQLRCHRRAGHLVLEVQDNGLGLSAAQQGELFRLFRRLHTHVSGSGVGLYMVKKMVENAGGTLTVQSEPGVGSTFTVTLPPDPGS